MKQFQRIHVTDHSHPLYKFATAGNNGHVIQFHTNAGFHVRFLGVNYIVSKNEGWPV